MEKVNKDAAWIVEKLRERGHTAYLVGGCVRDMIMGTKPKDWDVATNAPPDRVMSIFDKTIPVGAQFGVVIVRRRGRNYEVATFREEWGYEDGRRPGGVRFSTAKADAKRRDFTINGLFYDPVEGKVIDYVRGLRDLEAGVIRAIGRPEERFEEDKLRMLRAVRFSSRFGFRIARRTGEAIKKNAKDIEKVSAERVRDELVHILVSDNPADGIRKMDDYGLLEHILPEVKDMQGVEQPEKFHPEGDVFEHTMIMLEMMKKKYKKAPELALAVLLHDVGKPPTFEIKDRIRFNNHAPVGRDMAEQILKRLRFPNSTVKTVTSLVGDHLKFIEVKNMRPARLMRFIRQDDFDLHLELHWLDCKASHGDLENYFFCKEKLKEAGESKEKLRPRRLITGNDLKALGLKPGPLFKKILSELEDLQLEGTIVTREEALDWVRENYL